MKKWLAMLLCVVMMFGMMPCALGEAAVVESSMADMLMQSVQKTLAPLNERSAAGGKGPGLYNILFTLGQMLSQVDDRPLDVIFEEDEHQARVQVGLNDERLPIAALTVDSTRIVAEARREGLYISIPSFTGRISWEELMKAAGIPEALNMQELQNTVEKLEPLVQAVVLLWKDLVNHGMGLDVDVQGNIMDIRFDSRQFKAAYARRAMEINEHDSELIQKAWNSVNDVYRWFMTIGNRNAAQTFRQLAVMLLPSVMKDSNYVQSGLLQLPDVNVRLHTANNRDEMQLTGSMRIQENTVQAEAVVDYDHHTLQGSVIVKMPDSEAVVLTLNGASQDDRIWLDVACRGQKISISLERDRYADWNLADWNLTIQTPVGLCCVRFNQYGVHGYMDIAVDSHSVYASLDAEWYNVFELVAAFGTGNDRSVDEYTVTISNREITLKRNTVRSQMARIAQMGAAMLESNSEQAKLRLYAMNATSPLDVLITIEQSEEWEGMKLKLSDTACLRIGLDKAPLVVSAEVREIAAEELSGLLDTIGTLFE